jgi:hypothetical protein
MKEMTRDEFYKIYSELLMDDNIDEQVKKITNKKQKKSIENEFLIVKKNEIPEKSKSWYEKIISYIFK